MSGFVHLHLHSIFSVLDGAIKIPELVKRLQELDQNSCALTDHGSMFGSVKFYKELKKHKIKPIIGCELYMTPGSRFEKSTEIFHLIALCQDKEGYKNLSKLLTLANTEGFYYKPRVDREILEKYNKGLIITSACLKGELSQRILNGRYEEAKSTAKWFSDVFEKRYYIELQDNGIKEQYIANEKLINISNELSLPIVATNDCHYIKKSDAFVQEVLICVSTKKTLQDTNRMKMTTDEFYIKNYEEMSSGYFKDYPAAISNTVKIAEECNFSFKTGINYLPVMGKDEDESKNIIDKESRAGLLKRNCPAELKQVYEDRLNFELNIIKTMGFSSYYLIVSDFIKWAKNNDIPVGPGRGSGAASLVAYTLDITNIDPIKYDLIFERFLNPERVSLPDFDIDFCSRKRDEVFNYLVKRYGDDYTTRIATFGFLKAKSAIKDVGRVLGYPYKDVEDITKMLPNRLDLEPLSELMRKEPQLRELISRDESAKKLLQIAASVEGSVRNVGVHAGGVIISSVPVVDIVPLLNAKGDVIATQFDMKDIETVGLVKFDLLAIETLTIIYDAIKHIKKFKLSDFDIEKASLEDPKIFKMLSNGDTDGVFQLESSGMKKLLRDLKPDCFEDIIAVNALYRPGPLSGGMVDEFIGRKHGRLPVDYPFPELEGILKETNGIIVYQEQVQRIAAVLAGYSLGEADLLRRAMGKKIAKEMQAQKERFIRGATEKGHDSTKAEELFELMAKFAEYGFNKAHAAVYALNAFRTAYLKCYYPAEFLSALLTAKVGKQKGSQDVDPVTLYIADAVSHNIKILAPDVNESVYDFEPRGEDVRFGLGGIKNIGSSAIDNILEERSSGGLFKGFVDFCSRVDTRKVNKKVLEHLIMAGAFDQFSINRGILCGNIDRILDSVSEYRKDIESGQGNLFDTEQKQNLNDSALLMTFELWNEAKYLEHEKEVIGFYISSHPIDSYEQALRFSGVPELASLGYVPPKHQIIAAGILTLTREIITKRGKEMGIFNFEDKSGNIEAVAFSDTYMQIKDLRIAQTTPVICIGKIDEEHGKKIMLSGIKLLTENDFVLDIRVRENLLSREQLEVIAKNLPKTKNGVAMNFEILFPEEGVVVFEIGKASIPQCFLFSNSLKETLFQEVNVRWNLKSFS